MKQEKNIDDVAVKVDVESTKASDVGVKSKVGSLVDYNKKKLTERDLLMMCVDSPYYLSKALGHDNADGTGLNSMEE